MQLTIERLRTIVLVAGVLLFVALGAFLAVAKFKNPLNLKELPKQWELIRNTRFTLRKRFS